MKTETKHKKAQGAKGGEVAEPNPSGKSFVRRDNIPKRVEKKVLQERISRALAISHGYARFASRLNECSCVIMNLVLAVCLAAQKECHQIWRCVVLLLLRESAIVLARLDAAPQPSLIPKMIVLLNTHVNTGVASKATLRQVLALQRSATHLMLADIIKTVQMTTTTTLTHSITSVGSRN